MLKLFNLAPTLKNNPIFLRASKLSHLHKKMHHSRNQPQITSKQ